MSVEVVHRPEQSRFTAQVGGSTGLLTYDRAGRTVAMTHTIVPPEIGGRGVASALTAAAVAWARDQGLAVDPQCSYVRAWLDRHPDA